MAVRTDHYISIASGIGGLDLGVELGSGGSAVPVCYVEIEATAAAVLAARMAEGAMPEAPVWSDLHTFDGSAWRGLVDGIVGGYPCQPFSAAGRQRGFDDPRNLWPDIEQLIKNVRPQWCFFENVEGHLRNGYFDHVKPGLEAAGYRVEEQVCAASDVGAPHRRRRIFILAVEDAELGDARDREKHGQAIRCAGAGAFIGSGSAVADTAEPRLQGSRRASADASGADAEARDRFERGRAADDVEFPPGPDSGRWEEILAQTPHLAPAIESALRGVADGPPGGLGLTRAEQIRLLGNAVVPQQAALAWRLLWAEMRNTPDGRLL